MKVSDWKFPSPVGDCFFELMRELLARFYEMDCQFPSPIGDCFFELIQAFLFQLKMLILLKFPSPVGDCFFELFYIDIDDGTPYEVTFPSPVGDCFFEHYLL